MCFLLGKTNNNVIYVKNWDLSNVPLQCLYKRAILTARNPAPPQVERSQRLQLLSMVSTVNGKYNMAQFLKKDNNILLNEGVSIVTGKMAFLLFVSHENKAPLCILQVKTKCCLICKLRINLSCTDKINVHKNWCCTSLQVDKHYY